MDRQLSAMAKQVDEIFDGRTAPHFDLLNQDTIEAAVANTEQIAKTDALYKSRKRQMLRSRLDACGRTEETEHDLYLASVRAAISLYLEQPSLTIGWMVRSRKYWLLSRVLLMAGRRGWYPTDPV